jgi:hypothetical protein
VLYPCFLAGLVKQADIFTGEGPFLPGAGVFCEYLYGSAVIVFGRKQGVMQPLCNGKVGAQKAGTPLITCEMPSHFIRTAP